MKENATWDELLDEVVQQREKLEEYGKLIKDKNSTYNPVEVNNYIKQVSKNYDDANRELEKLDKKHKKVLKLQDAARKWMEETEKRTGDNYYSTHPLMRALLGM